MSTVSVIQRLPKADGALRCGKTLSDKARQRAACFVGEVSAPEGMAVRSGAAAQHGNPPQRLPPLTGRAREERRGRSPALCPCGGRSPPGARCPGGGDPLRPPRPRWRAPAPGCPAPLLPAPGAAAGLPPPPRSAPELPPSCPALPGPRLEGVAGVATSGRGGGGERTPRGPGSGGGICSA